MRTARKSQRRAGRVTALVGAVAWGAALGACASQGYTLTGKVIESEISFVVVVDADDPRLEQPGIAGAEVRLQTDPSKLNREVVGEAVTDGTGVFHIKVDRVGAGMFLYDVGVQARKSGFEPAGLEFRLPPEGRRVLVMMRPGRVAGMKDEDDLWKQYEKFR